MGYVVTAAVVLLIVGALLTRHYGLLGPEAVAVTTGENLPFRKKDYLLSKAERSFYKVLEASLNGQFVIFTKVRLLDLLWLPKGTEKAQSYRNRVQSKHVDFVLCDHAALKPMLVIELDDASHKRPGRQARDRLVDNVLATAGLPILHVRAQTGYSPMDINNQINAAIATPVTQ